MKTRLLICLPLATALALGTVLGCAGARASGEDGPDALEPDIEAEAAAEDAAPDDWRQAALRDPRWLADRLMMRWTTRARTTFVKGEHFDHLGGGAAPVPTVMMDAARSHATSLHRPSLTELSPRNEFWCTNFAASGRIVGSVNREIAGKALELAEEWRQDGDSRKYRAAFEVLDTYLRGIYWMNKPVEVRDGHVNRIVGFQSFEVIQEAVAETMARLYIVLAPQKDRGLYEAALRKWADLIVENGVPFNNWNIIQARRIYLIARALPADDRKRYLDIILQGNLARQWGLAKLAAYGFDAAGIWNESPGYSLVVVKEFLDLATDLKRDEGIDLFAQVPVLAKVAEAGTAYLYPDGMVLGFGDTHPGPLKWRTSGAWTNYACSVKAAWLMVKNGMDKDRSLAFALNASLGNHMHANGLSLEVYGKGLRLAPDAGIGYTLYGGKDYREYYSRFPAHNTVCVDGVSDYPAMLSTHGFEAVKELRSGRLHGAQADFIEPVTGARQRRQTALVADSYFVDVFRSRRPDKKDRFHDYFLHGLGTRLTLDAPTSRDTGDLKPVGKCLRAYSYFKDVEGCRTGRDVAADWSVPGGVHMRMWMKGAPGRTIYRANAPSTEGLSRLKGMPYDIRNHPTLTFVARQDGEAWNRPFVAVIQPGPAADAVMKVEFPESADGVVIRVTRASGAVDTIVSRERGMTMTGGHSSAQTTVAES